MLTYACTVYLILVMEQCEKKLKRPNHDVRVYVILKYGGEGVKGLKMTQCANFAAQCLSVWLPPHLYGAYHILPEAKFLIWVEKKLLKITHPPAPCIQSEKIKKLEAAQVLHKIEFPHRGKYHRHSNIFSM